MFSTLQYLVLCLIQPWIGFDQTIIFPILLPSQKLLDYLTTMSYWLLGYKHGKKQTLQCMMKTGGHIVKGAKLKVYLEESNVSCV